jgi:hypothetical protein
MTTGQQSPGPPVKQRDLLVKQRDLRVNTAF